MLPGIVPQNSNLRSHVGEFIHPYVAKLVGEARANEITGMLLTLDLNKIKGYLYDFNTFCKLVAEA